MITPELKDKLLKDLVETGMHLSFSIHEIAKEYGTDTHTLDALLEYFESLNFLVADRLLGGTVMISMKVQAHDFYSHGGFTAQEALLKMNFEKLLLEIESLKPSMPDKIEKITNIISGITTGLSLFISK